MVAPGLASVVAPWPMARRCCATQALEAADVEEDVEPAQVSELEVGHVAHDEGGVGRGSRWAALTARGTLSTPTATQPRLASSRV